MLDDLAGLSVQEKIAEGISAYKILRPVLKLYDQATDGLGIAFDIMSTAVAADSVLSENEILFIDELLKVQGVSMDLEEVLTRIRNRHNDEVKAKIQELDNGLQTEHFGALRMFVAAICALDSSIAPEEFAYLEELLVDKPELKPLKGLLEEYAKRGEDQIREEALESFSTLLPTFEKYDKKNEGMELLLSVIGTAIAADGVLSPKEQELINTLLDSCGYVLPEEEMVKLLRNAAKEDVKKKIRAFDDLLEAKEEGQFGNLRLLIAAIIAIDGDVADEEVSFLESLLERKAG
jgi:uncharacterized membrane protein YebE (DUF533 family)